MVGVAVDAEAKNRVDAVHPALLSVSVHINEEIISALVDSGASYNFVSTNIVKHFGWQTCASE